MTRIYTYDELKTGYENFKKNLPEDSFERYAQELIHIRNLIQSAKLQGLNDDVSKYQKIEKIDIKELQKLGYNIK